jgi:hypothetical protein
MEPAKMEITCEDGDEGERRRGVRWRMRAMRE